MTSTDSGAECNGAATVTSPDIAVTAVAKCRERDGSAHSDYFSLADESQQDDGPFGSAAAAAAPRMSPVSSSGGTQSCSSSAGVKVPSVNFVDGSLINKYQTYSAEDQQQILTQNYLTSEGVAPDLDHYSHHSSRSTGEQNIVRIRPNSSLNNRLACPGSPETAQLPRSAPSNLLSWSHPDRSVKPTTGGGVFQQPTGGVVQPTSGIHQQPTCGEVHQQPTGGEVQSSMHECSSIPTSSNPTISKPDYSVNRYHSSFGNNEYVANAVAQGLAVIGTSIDKKVQVLKHKNQELSSDSPFVLPNKYYSIKYPMENKAAMPSTPRLKSLPPKQDKNESIICSERESSAAVPALVIERSPPKPHGRHLQADSVASILQKGQQQNKHAFTTVSAALPSTAIAQSNPNTWGKKIDESVSPWFGYAMHKEPNTDCTKDVPVQLDSSDDTTRNTNDEIKNADYCTPEVNSNGLVESASVDNLFHSTDVQKNSDNLFKRNSLESVGSIKGSQCSNNMFSTYTLESGHNALGSQMLSNKRHDYLNCDLPSKDSLLHKLMSKSSTDLMPATYDRPSSFTRSLRHNSQLSLRSVGRPGPLRVSEPAPGSRDDRLAIEVAQSLVSQSLRDNKVTDLLSKIKEKRPTCDVNYNLVKRSIERQHAKMFSKPLSHRSSATINDNRSSITTLTARSESQLVRKSRSLEKGLNVNPTASSRHERAPSLPKRINATGHSSPTGHHPTVTASSNHINRKLNIPSDFVRKNLTASDDNMLKTVPRINLSGIDQASNDESLEHQPHDSLSSINFDHGPADRPPDCFTLKMPHATVGSATGTANSIILENNSPGPRIAAKLSTSSDERLSNTVLRGLAPGCSSPHSNHGAATPAAGAAELCLIFVLKYFE